MKNKISLEKSKKIKLFKRFESKYIIDESDINLIFDWLNDNYLLVEDDGINIFDYYSLYFDNSNLDTIKAHERNDLVRQKIRIREYYNGDKFLEIKEKNNHKTIKTRIPVNSYEINNEKNWISENLIYDTMNLTKTLEIKYKRMTFISKNFSNRITLDFNIDFHNYITNKDYKIDKVVIIEIKKNTEDNIEFENFLNNTLWIYKTKFSKYYNGMEKTNELF